MHDIELPDTSLTLLEAIQHNETRNAHYPLFRYQDIDGTIVSVTWGQAGKAFTIAGHIVLEGVGAGVNLSMDHGHSKVVGILANLDSITFYSLIVGIMRAGFTPFPISIRNSPEAVAHLMAATGCSVLVDTDDAVTSQLASASIKIFEEGGPTKRSARTILAPTFEQLYGSEAFEVNNLASRVRTYHTDVDKSAIPCVISHSSGTTSLPKPITLTNRMINQHGTRNRYELEEDYRCRTLSAHAIPMYHMMGLSLIPWSTMLGLTLSVIRPRKPPILPSPDFVLRGAIATASSILYCAPTFLESWASESTNVDALKSFDKILYGGGPVRDDIATTLVKQGAKLLPIMGLSETGVITTFYPKHIQNEGPAWYETDSRLDVVFIPEDEENLKGVYRLAIRENSFRKPASFDTMIDGVPAFDTKDLVMLHPTNPKLWKIVGRADDQITHSTGEKTNPVPIEAMLQKSPYISAALMFGRAKVRPGVLIMPSPEYVFDISDNKRFDGYLNIIRDAVTIANQHSPQHSRIFEEMILVVDPHKPFEYTSKGTIRRKITLDKYEKEIEQLYEVTELSSSADIEKPASLEPAEIKSFIRSTVHRILEHEVKDDDDIFRAGADSLCTLSIRISITRGLQGLVSRSSTDTLPRDLVYIYPTIYTLAEFITGPFLSAQSQSQSENANGLDSIEEDLKWEALLKSKEMVIELAPGLGEPPLILIHGAGGNIDHFRSFMNATSAVWAIQMTDEVPMGSTENITAYYFDKIKEKLPHGPYRFAAYSGSSVYIIELITLFERNGDEVTQFAMLDHSPALFFPGLSPSGVQVNNAEWMDKYLSNAIHTIANLLIPSVMERQRLLSNTVIVRRFQELMDALNGSVIPPHLEQFVKKTKVMQETSLRYLMRKEFMTINDKGEETWSLELFRKFTANIKAPLTLYVATEGAIIFVPREMTQEMQDLGASKFFADFETVVIQGDHSAFLEEEDLHRSLEGQYYRGKN